MIEVNYRDRNGKLLWKEPLTLMRLHKPGDIIVQDGREYTVLRMALADEIQHINLDK